MSYVSGTTCSPPSRRALIATSHFQIGDRKHRSFLLLRHCQNNFKAPTLDEEVERLCGTELAPLGESGGTVQLEIFAAVEMALLIEMIVYG